MVDPPKPQEEDRSKTEASPAGTRAPQRPQPSDSFNEPSDAETRPPEQDRKRPESEAEEASPTGRSDVASIALALGQAYSSFMAGNMRFAGRMLELLGDGQNRLVTRMAHKEALGDLSRRDLAVLVDELRAGIRELADLSLDPGGRTAARHPNRTGGQGSPTVQKAVEGPDLAP